MTANQINYAKHLEDVRSHRVNEEIAARQTAASEMSAQASASQAQSSSRNADTNLINSEINRLSAEASQMSAMASQTMAAASYMNAQTERMYKEAQVRLEEAKQSETSRHNWATESKDLLQIETSRDIATLDRNERAREADQSNETTRRGQNFSLAGSLVSSGVSLGTSLLKTFNPLKLITGGVS